FENRAEQLHRWYDVYAFRFGEPEKRQVAILFNDITGRKEVEEGLRSSQERFRTVMETANDAIVSADSDGNIIQFNKAAERTFGYTMDEAIGKPLTLLMPFKFHEAHRSGFARFLSTGVAHVVGRTVELAGRRKDGSEFPLELSL